MSNKKVEIIIEDFTDKFPYAVGFNATNYGSGNPQPTRARGAGGPCNNEAEIKSVVEHCREWIKREGDIPITKDLRKKALLTRWI